MDSFPLSRPSSLPSHAEIAPRLIDKSQMARVDLTSPTIRVKPKLSHPCVLGSTKSLVECFFLSVARLDACLLPSPPVPRRCSLTQLPDILPLVVAESLALLWVNPSRDFGNSSTYSYFFSCSKGTARGKGTCEPMGLTTSDCCKVFLMLFNAARRSGLT